MFPLRCRHVPYLRTPLSGILGKILPFSPISALIALLVQREYERHYRRFHATLPTIIAAPSSTLDADAWAGRFRIIHIDGGHQYDVVREDI